MRRASSSLRRGPLPLLLLALAVLVAACGGGQGGAASETGEQSATGGASDAAVAETDYPADRIELILPWAAGGGTDRMARMMAPFLADELGADISVVNRTGGGGVVGHTAMANGSTDGSVLGLATLELTMLHWQGLTDLTYDDVEPIATLGANSASVTVAADSPFQTVDDLLAHAEQNPGDLIGSGTATGGIWHIGVIGMLAEAGIPSDAIEWVPSDGGAPALQELLAGGIDISFASLPENATQLEAGGVRALAVMADERDSNFPDVPTLKEQGIDWSASAPFMLVAPKGTSEELLEILEDAAERVSDNEEFRDLMATNMFGSLWWDREETIRRLQETDEVMGELLVEAGIGQPES